MPSKEHTGGYSRSVHHNNMMNRKGMTSQYQKSVVSTKVPMKHKNMKIAPPNRREVHNTDQDIIEGKPPKMVLSKETRFTIPDVPVNGNINTQTYVRSHAKMAVALNEFKTQVKVKNFNEDCDHEIVVM
jgi:hypothetical protein